MQMHFSKALFRSRQKGWKRGRIARKLLDRFPKMTNFEACELALQIASGKAKMPTPVSDGNALEYNQSVSNAADF